MRNFVLPLALFGALTLSAAGTGHAATPLPEDKYSAVVLVYHRIGEEAYPDSNLRTDQFLEHLEELSSGDYTVMPLAEIVDAMRNHRELPPRALAITFEGAYKSAFDKAMPLLLEKHIPFTVFYSAGQFENGGDTSMNESELKSLAAHPEVTLGVLPASYSRLIDQPEDEIRRQVNNALVKHRELFGKEPGFFSYPFGEYSLAYKKIAADSGFKAAFGLHSGTVYEGSDFFALPRFTMTEKFGDLERFRLVVNALPLPATDIEPQEPHLGAAPPSIGFSLPEALARESSGLSCFISSRGEITPEIIGNRVELRLKDVPGDERVRLNCTMPGPTDTVTDVEQWRWLGMMLTGETVPETAAGDTDDDEASPPPDGPQ